MSWKTYTDLGGEVGYAVNAERIGISMPVRYLHGDVARGYDPETDALLVAIADRHRIRLDGHPIEAGVEEVEPPDGYDAVEWMIFDERACAAPLARALVVASEVAGLDEPPCSVLFDRLLEADIDCRPDGDGEDIQDWRRLARAAERLAATDPVVATLIAQVVRGEQ